MREKTKKGGRLVFVKKRGRKAKGGKKKKITFKFEYTRRKDKGGRPEYSGERVYESRAACKKGLQH